MACLMAFDGTQPAGFASWALTFPAGNGTALLMKELFVSKPFRRHGVGRALLAGLIRIAQQEDCVRFDWQTDGDNADAQAFYAELNAPRHSKISFRIPAAAFGTFRDSLKPED